MATPVATLRTRALDPATLERTIAPSLVPAATGERVVGALRFDSVSYARFRRDQRALGGTPQQIAILESLRKDDVPDFIPEARSEPAAPIAGTTISGEARFGSVRMRARDGAIVEGMLATLRNVDASVASAETAHYWNVLASAKRVTRLRLNQRGRNAYDPRTRTLFFDPRLGGSDRPPIVAFRHELAHAVRHAIDPWIGRTLERVPHARFGNYEEAAVVCGSEARLRTAMGLAPRTAREAGRGYRVASATHVAPAIRYRDADGERVLRSGLLAGRVERVNRRRARFVATDGTRFTIRLSEMVGLFSDVDEARKTLAEACDAKRTFGVSIVGNVAAPLVADAAVV